MSTTTDHRPSVPADVTAQAQSKAQRVAIRARIDGFSEDECRRLFDVTFAATVEGLTEGTR